MWKVLIADDEPKIRRGLRSLLGRCAPGLEVVGEAEDGEMALERALALEPDILLIDIRMPFKSGIELITSLNEALPNRIIIIVSGHDEFEYAQAAIKLRVFDYLLKPLVAEVFAQVIERAVAELEQRAQTGKYAAWAREQLERNIPVLRERFLRDWVTGTLSRTELSESLAFLRVSLEPPTTLIAARFAELFAPASSNGLRRLELVALRTIMEESLPRQVSYVFEDETEAVLAVTSALDEAAIIAAKEEIERRAGSQALHLPVIATRTLADPIARMSDAYEELREELAVGDKCEAHVILARNYIDKEYWKPGLSLEDAAETLQLSPGYLSRLLKRETGCSFVEYLTRIRIRKAMHLMGDPSAKIYEVAERVGYRSQHYFSRAFRKVMGFAPTDYRKGGAA